MSNIDYIINLCHNIAEQGKTPSVALIRNISQHPVSIPEVVKALQHWKSAPRQRPKANNITINDKAPPAQSLEERVAQLEEQVAYITQKLALSPEDI